MIYLFILVVVAYGLLDGYNMVKKSKVISWISAAAFVGMMEMGIQILPKHTAWHFWLGLLVLLGVSIWLGGRLTDKTKRV
jgi:hypothetical protein